MKINFFAKCILSVIILFWSGLSMAQTNKLPEPQMETSDDGIGPPPPGLVVSIDEGIPIVLTVGIGVGIYFLRKVKPTCSSL